MNIGSKICGFAVTNTRHLPELNANLWEMEHEKTGAKLCWLDNGALNKLFAIGFTLMMVLDVALG